VTERADFMAASVARAATGAGLGAPEVELLGRAHALAMAPRIAQLDDDHHPAYLHPGRGALILLRDVGPVPVETLCAVAVHETEDAGLRVDLANVRAALGEPIADMVASLPMPGDKRLLERLVTLDQDALLAALAERLDQLRHAHVRKDHDLEWRTRIHEEAGAVWGPVAERTHPRLGDRFRHWHTAFGRRLERERG